jgi:2-polyprenyl-6-methoxyphenol hydroxylase-like FAD-dependent oxidoreductase
VGLRLAATQFSPMPSISHRATSHSIRKRAGVTMTEPAERYSQGMPPTENRVPVGFKPINRARGEPKAIIAISGEYRSAGSVILRCREQPDNRIASRRKRVPSDRPMNETQVLIIGAGPAGLALAIELGSRSVPCLLIERNERAGYAPRAKTTHSRTREHLRRWGIADQLAAASPLGVDYPSNVIFVTRLAGPGITRFEHALSCLPVRDERYSEHSQWIPQYKLEAVLLEHARSLPAVQIAFGRELIDFEQDDYAVRARIRHSSGGLDEVVQCKYLIGADGARSMVRDQIGAKMVGSYGLSRNYNTIFHAPGLAEAHSHGPGIMYWQLNEDVPSLIGPMDEGDLWYFMPTGLAAGVTYTEAETLDLIRISTGIDLPYRILSSDEWVASRLLADKYRADRVFLTGDACHLHPPFGGYGMNMGIADSVDLGWKIAAVLQGWGGGVLLDSYEIERRPAHEYVMDEAQKNHALAPNQLVRDKIEELSPVGDAVRKSLADMIWASKTSEFYGLGVVLGYCYQHSPVIVERSDECEWTPSHDYIPSARPGCLAPHSWMKDGRSLYDLFGPGFSLLVLNEAGSASAEKARQEAANSNTPLKILTLPDSALAALYQSSLALIRPDQIVAWRGEEWQDGLLYSVTGRHIGQDVPSIA